MSDERPCYHCGEHHPEYWNVPQPCQNIYVPCDQHCKALQKPVTFEEVKAALEHWQEHGLYHGCSHGC